jgi:hypothetical protein
MKQVNSPEESTDVRSFSYGGSTRYWWRYLPVGLGFVFVYSVLVQYGFQPLANLWFQLIGVIAVADIIGIAVLRAKSPREFQIRGDELLLRWPSKITAVPLRGVSVNRPLSWLFSGATALKAGETIVVVFHDLKGYPDLISLITESKAPV